jgi:AcrR family transcriptional regulator
VYAQHGFRGATTRLIAIEAGVNEVSLFRTFGSKAALFEAMMQSHSASLPLPALPERPVDPQAELTPWCSSLLAHMRQWRSIIRKSFGELEERPEAATVMCEGPNCAAMALSAYVARLHAAGLADETADVATAVSMFISPPDAFPQPVEDAPTKYVNVFLRAVGALGAGDVVPLRAAQDAEGRRAVAQ